MQLILFGLSKIAHFKKSYQGISERDLISKLKMEKT